MSKYNNVLTEEVMKIDNGEQKFVAFVKARESLRINKESGVDKALWTDEELFKQYKFCNVHREDDTGTKDNDELIRPFWFHYEYPVYAVLARYLNRRESLEILNRHLNDGFQLEELRSELHRVMANGKKIFNPAYKAFVSRTKGNRVDLIFDRLLYPIMDDLDEIHEAIHTGDNRKIFESVQHYHMGDFITQQIVIDMAHTPLMEDNDYKDNFTVMGPGSTRGMFIIFGDVDDFEDKIDRLKALFSEDMTSHDIQNCLCEFNKYIRAGLGQKVVLKKYK